MAENVVKDPTSEELEKLISESLSSLHVGEIVTGKIARVEGNSVLIDLGWKSEGVRPRNPVLPWCARRLRAVCRWRFSASTHSCPAPRLTFAR